MKLNHGRAGVFLAIAAAMAWHSPNASAADLHIGSDTIIRRFERDTKTRGNLKMIPAYEYLQLDYGNLKTPGLSLHAYGWGRVNLGDEDDYLKGDTEGQLIYAYLQYTPPSGDYLVRAGRQYVFEGVANESIDGVYGKTDLIPTVTLSAYAGYPVSLDTVEGHRGDRIYGGRISHHHTGLYDLGASYKFIANNSTRDKEFFAGDFSVSLPWNISLMGRSTLNLVSGSWGEHFYEARIPYGPVEFRPFYQYFRYEDFFGTGAGSANPFRFLAGTGNKITVAGTEAYWYPNEHLEMGLRFKHYDYEQRFGDARYYTLLAVWKRKVLSEVGFEFGRMDGKAPENRYYLGRAYFFWNLPPGFVTGDLQYVDYDKQIYRKGSSFFSSFGLGRQFLDDTLKIKLSLDYSNDPYFRKDYRGMLSASYLFDAVVKGLPGFR